MLALIVVKTCLARDVAKLYTLFKGNGNMIEIDHTNSVAQNMVDVTIKCNVQFLSTHAARLIKHCANNGLPFTVETMFDQRVKRTTCVADTNYYDRLTADQKVAYDMASQDDE